MTTEIETAKPIETQVAEWSATDAGLRAVVETTAGISVEAHAEGPAKGYKAVEAARKLLKVHRTAIEGRRKELKAPILELGKLVDAEAKRLTEIVEPREMELAADAKAYEDRLEAERKAEEARVAAERAEAERLAREAEEHKQAEEAAAALEAARRPDLEKLRTWASEWLAARPELPEIADKSIEAAMLKAARDVADILSSLT